MAAIAILALNQEGWRKLAFAPTATATATPTATATATSTTTATPTATPIPSPTPTPTSTPTASAVITTTTAITTDTASGPGSLWPTPDAAQAQEHYWLARVTGPDTTQWASPFYPYGSTGRGKYLLHQGADIANPLGTRLLAPADGTVVFAGRDDQVALGPSTDFYGLATVIELDRRYREQPVYVLLGHMNAVYVKPGDRVRRGQRIGEVGMTGIAMGPHVHVEVRVGANDRFHTRNAEFWLQPLPGHGTLAGRVLAADGRHLPDVEVLLYPGPDFKAPRYYTFTYQDEPGLINPDDEWGENFLLADLAANTYLVEVTIGGKLYRQEVQIGPGRTSWIEIRAP